MDPVTTAILTVLAAGASKLGEKVISDAYSELKELIKSKFGAKSDLIKAMEGLEAKPGSKARKESLKEEITATRADQDAELLRAAQGLLETIKAAPGGNQLIQTAIGDQNIQIAGDRNVLNFNMPVSSTADQIPGFGLPRQNFEISSFPPANVDRDLLVRFALSGMGSTSQSFDTETKRRILDAITQSPIDKWIRYYSRPVSWDFVEPAKSFAVTILSPASELWSRTHGPFLPNFSIGARFLVTLFEGGIVLDIWLKELPKGQTQPAWYPLALDVFYSLLLAGSESVTDPLLTRQLPEEFLHSPRLFTQINAKNASWIDLSNFRCFGSVQAFGSFDYPAEFSESERTTEIERINKDRLSRLLADFGCMDHERSIQQLHLSEFWRR